MPIFPKSNVLLLDPAEGLTDANRWKDSSGNGYHALPGAAYAAPAFGLANGPSGAPYILASGGANAFATLSTDFYAKAPTTGLTVCLVQKFTAPAANDFIFSTFNAARTRGMAVEFSSAERLRLYGYDAAGAVTLCGMTADGPLTGRTCVVVMALSQAGSLARCWLDGQGVAATFAGSLNPIAYDTAVVPTLWRASDFAGGYNDGNVYTFQVDDRVWTHAEAVAFSSFWRDRT